MKLNHVIVILTLSSLNTAYAAVEYIVSKDEMSDTTSYLVWIESENYGKYKYQGKGALVYKCSSGKQSVILTVPDYLSDSPKKVKIRFDKEIPYESTSVSGTANKKGVIVNNDSPLLMENMIYKNKAIARAYNWEWISDASYNFNLSGVAKFINKANKAGGCQTLAQRKEEKLKAEKQKHKAQLVVKKLLEIEVFNKIDGGIINIKTKDWFSLSPETQKALEKAIEKKARLFIVNDNDPNAIQLFE